MMQVFNARRAEQEDMKLNVTQTENQTQTTLELFRDGIIDQEMSVHTDDVVSLRQELE